MSSRDASVVPADEIVTGVSTRQEFNSTEMMRSAETAQNAMAQQQKALIESRFVVAMRMKRNWHTVRSEISRLCENPDFASEALYAKPIGMVPDGWERMTKRERLIAAPKNWPQGFSIRAIEAILFEMGNVDSNAMIVWEDDDQRMTQVSVIDLERNTGYTRTVITKKRVERQRLRGNQEAISQRQNTRGQTVFLVDATADEVNLAEAAGVSKAIRTMGERLIRPELKAEWRRKCEETIHNQAARDPEGEIKKLIDAFVPKGVTPAMLEAYLEHPIAQTSPAEIIVLRKLWTALAAGEVTWKEITGSKDPTGDDEEKSSNPQTEKVLGLLKKRKEGQEPQSTASAASTASVATETASPAPPSAPSASEPTPATQTPPVDDGVTLRDYDEFPDPPAEDGVKVSVKGKVYVSRAGSWRPVNGTEKPTKKGRTLNFGE